MEHKLKIPYSLRRKLVKKLSLVPEIASSVSEMGLSMQLQEDKKEIELARYLNSINVSLDDLKGDKAPSFIVDDPVWEIFGGDLLRLVKKELIKEGVVFTNEDAVFLSFLIADLIINGESCE
ncbi:hypothetical protein DRI96_05905 [Candidatus Aerophobetes bacterium]|uniref:Uncharacterized protein n=1 Tax=Aerophobetes bacterium TaxID=2030807 RepID=A0A662D857_UNCAE|nr:MAG: hypothetical protein DRI96_05905 [Candidatus Aerophobetes bacterium]